MNRNKKGTEHRSEQLHGDWREQKGREQGLKGNSSPGHAAWRTITIREQLEKVGRIRMGASAHS